MDAADLPIVDRNMAHRTAVREACTNKSAEFSTFSRFCVEIVYYVEIQQLTVMQLTKVTIHQRDTAKTVGLEIWQPYPVTLAGSVPASAANSASISSIVRL